MTLLINHSVGLWCFAAVNCCPSVMFRICRQRSALQVFTTLALVGMLIIPLNSFPWVLNSILEAKVSLERIQRFLKLSNRDLQLYYTQGVMLL